MKKLTWTLLLLLTVFASGCGRKPQSAQKEPLTLAEWKGVPSDVKFEFEALERLKAGNPKFQDDAEWDKFARAVVVPARKKELPKSVAK